MPPIGFFLAFKSNSGLLENVQITDARVVLGGAIIKPIDYKSSVMT